MPDGSKQLSARSTSNYPSRQVLSFGHLVLMLSFVFSSGALLEKSLASSGLDISEQCMYLL